MKCASVGSMLFTLTRSCGHALMTAIQSTNASNVTPSPLRQTGASNLRSAPAVELMVLLLLVGLVLVLVLVFGPRPITGTFMNKFNGSGPGEGEDEGEGNANPSVARALCRLSTQLAWYVSSGTPSCRYRGRSHAGIKVSWIPGEVSCISLRIGVRWLVTRVSPGRGERWRVEARVWDVERWIERVSGV